jgi:hypothetical protein
MNGEYNPRVMVYKSRHTTGQGYTITQEQARILQDCVLNNKTPPDFMNLEKLRNQERLYRVGSVEEAREVLNKASNREILDEVARRNDINRRLRKLEEDLNVYPDETICPILVVDNVTQRLSQIERKLGVVKSPGDDLGRLEQCEFYLKNTYWRLNKLDEEIYPTRKDIYEMPAVITLDGWCQRLETRLGVNLAFTDVNHRLKHIEDAWCCTKAAASYVCPELKDQKALQDGLIDLFGKKTYLKPVGYRCYLMGRSWVITDRYDSHNLYYLTTVDGENELEWLMPAQEFEGLGEFSTKPRERNRPDPLTEFDC